jgi:hypothetical protein
MLLNKLDLKHASYYLNSDGKGSLEMTRALPSEVSEIADRQFEAESKQSPLNICGPIRSKK